jgi:hypothetical protein
MVFSKGDIQGPMQRIFNRPMGAWRRELAVHRQAD